MHKCQRLCHKGECLGDEICKQPCTTSRADCGHPCMAPCHLSLPCPVTACKAKVRSPGSRWGVGCGPGAANESRTVCSGTLAHILVGGRWLQGTSGWQRERWASVYQAWDGLFRKYPLPPDQSLSHFDRILKRDSDCPLHSFNKYLSVCFV